MFACVGVGERKGLFRACELIQLYTGCLCTPTHNDLITRGSLAGLHNRTVYNERSIPPMVPGSNDEIDYKIHGGQGK